MRRISTKTGHWKGWEAGRYSLGTSVTLYSQDIGYTLLTWATSKLSQARTQPHPLMNSSGSLVGPGSDPEHT